MTPAARLQTSVDLSVLIWDAHVPMDKIVNDFFRTHRHIGSKDRADIGDRVYSVMRHNARLNWWCERLNTSGVRMRTFLHAILVEGMTAKQLVEMCTGDKYAPGQLKGSDIEKLEYCSGQTINQPDMPDHVRYEYPQEADGYLKAVFGEDLPVRMEEMLTPAPLDLRVNTILSFREGVQKSLRKEGIDAEFMTESPWGLRVIGKVNLAGTKAYAGGWVDVQDEGSQMIALLCDVKPGEQVMDYCAGAGGKTLALAGMMENKGRIVAMDMDEKRLEKGKARYRKAGIHNVEVRPLSDEKQKSWVKRQKDKFDCVLVDAPCSSSGTWRRNPDLRWRQMGPTLEELLPLQAKILEDAAKLVKPGGRLVYATCSLNEAENNAQIERFLAAHDNFELTPEPAFPYKYTAEKGFFAQKMVKNNKNTTQESTTNDHTELPGNG